VRLARNIELYKMWLKEAEATVAAVVSGSYRCRSGAAAGTEKRCCANGGTKDIGRDTATKLCG
jgi:hypothetical protein